LLGIVEIQERLRTSTRLYVIAIFTITMNTINTSMKGGRGRNLIAIPTIISKMCIGTYLSLITTIYDGLRDTLRLTN